MNIRFDKFADGLAPAIVQDAATGAVLMLGYLNADALEQTRSTGRVTFYSRSRSRQWTKGETSGNYLNVVSIAADCDDDAILIRASPVGPTCHRGTVSCFGDGDGGPAEMLLGLEAVIDARRSLDPHGSYVAKLFRRGINKIAQKVGEEAVELVIEAKDDDREKLIGEAADLLFHYLVLLRAKDVSIRDVIGELENRRH